ncbi:MAG: OmpH family outer membrane protein [Chlamydiae bacterium]|nr:OmpH family outer membrane protein [Chlamydiota bacterium]
MKKSALIILVALLSALPMSVESAETPMIGVVNFKNCIEKSKIGQAEQKSFEELKTQMGAVLEKTEKELEDLSKKLNDSEYLESLSTEAQNEVKGRFQNMGMELSRYQNQYYQILNQANYKLVQELGTKVADAAKIVALAKKLAFIMNEDAFFYYASTFDVTSDVISELDKRYEIDSKLVKDKVPAGIALPQVSRK